jgi:hypothetical protein
MIAPSVLVDLVKPWADAYSNSKALATAVTFVHVAGLLFGGGLAVAADRGTLRAMRRDAGVRGSHLEELSAVHRVVLTGLALSLVSGLLLLAADLDTYFGSWIFWVKMGMVALLLANGFLMTRAERVLREKPDPESTAWARLHRASIVSLALWFAITLAGVALVNAA